MKFKTILQYCLPHHILSRIIGGIAKCRWSWLKNLLIHWFIKHYQIDLSDTIESNLYNYASFNDFFTRALKPEARPIPSNEKAIICPIDGFISQIGTITEGQIIQAKGHDFNLAALLGHDFKDFIDGNFATLYLSPKDYHRVHMPFTGKLTQMTHIPGKLFSVQPVIVNTIPNLYTRNERVINLFKTQFGSMAVILVGAMLVASIETVWAGTITPAGTKTIRTWDYDVKNIELTRGEEMGRFQFGSTVILLFPKNVIQWREDLKPETKIIMGQQLGEIL